MTIVRAYDRLREEGLIESRTGSGTYVAERPTYPAVTPILAQVLERGPLNLYEPLSEAAGGASLASSVPDPTLSPFEDILPLCFDVVRESPWAAYYAPPQGTSEFLNAVLDTLQGDGLPTGPDEIIATFGGSQARLLVLDTLSQPGDAVALEVPGRLDALGWTDRLGRRPIPVRRDRGMLDLDRLEAAFQEGAKLLFTMPTFGSTTGDVMPEEHRADLLALADRYGACIVEDASYARLGPSGPRSLAERGGEGVVMVDSFSYCVAPGLRLGYVRAAPAVTERLAAMAQLTTQSGVTPLQSAFGRWLARGGLVRHLRRVLPIYRARREAALDALRRTMPPGTRWTEPVGGLSLWLTLPDGEYRDLYDAAVAAGTPFAPGSLFVSGQGERHLRIAYGRHAPETLEAAITVVADLVRARCSI